MLYEFEECRSTTVAADSSACLEEYHPGWTHFILTHVLATQLARTASWCIFAWVVSEAAPLVAGCPELGC